MRELHKKKNGNCTVLVNLFVTLYFGSHNIFLTLYHFLCCIRVLLPFTEVGSRLKN